MEVPLGVQYASRVDIEVEGSADVLPLHLAPLKRGDTDLECEEGPDRLGVPGILVSESVEFVRLVVERDFGSCKLGV